MANSIERSESQYVNHFQVGHNAFEFILEFGQVPPGGETVVVRSRLITSPVSAKLLSTLLIDSVGRYEATYGAIADADGAETEGE